MLSHMQYLELLDISSNLSGFLGNDASVECFGKFCNRCDR